MKTEPDTLEKLGPVPFWRGTEKCRESLSEMYRKAMRAAAVAQSSVATPEKGRVYNLSAKSR